MSHSEKHQLMPKPEPFTQRSAADTKDHYTWCVSSAPLPLAMRADPSVVAAS